MFGLTKILSLIYNILILVQTFDIIFNNVVLLFVTTLFFPQLIMMYLEHEIGDIFFLYFI